MVQNDSDSSVRTISSIINDFAINCLTTLFIWRIRKKRKTIEQEMQMAKSTGQASVEEALEEDFTIR